MKILIFLLFIIAILLYLCAGFAILLFIVFGGEPDSFTKQFVTAIIAATLGFGGYGVWIGAETIRDRHSFSEELEYGTKESVRHKLYTLERIDKEKCIVDIFNKFYSSNTQEIISFLDDYDTYQFKYHSYIEKVREELSNLIEKEYAKAEENGSQLAWLDFTNEVPMDIFLEYASDKTLSKEFALWSNEDFAWERAMLLDSVVMAHKYIELYSHGKYDGNARKIILDDAYNYYSNHNNKPPYKITQNFTGYTSVTIRNVSSTPMNLKYSGTFDKGSKFIAGHSSAYLNLPNGYYSFIADATQGINVRNGHAFQTLNGGSIELSYSISQYR